MPIVRMPDGAEVSFPDDMPKEQIRGLISSKFPEAAQPKEMGLVEEYVTRPLGQTGRILAGGAASLADAGRLISDPINAAGYQISKALGADAAKEKFREWHDAPTLSQAAQKQYDAVTDSKFVPANNLERGVDMGGQFLTSIMAGKGVSDITKKGVDAVRNISTVSKAPVASADDIAAKANQAYAKAEEIGGTLPPESTNKFLDSIRKVAPQTDEAKAVAGENEVTKLLERMENLRDKPISLRAAQEIDEELGDVIDGLTELGRVNKKGRRVMEVQNAFRDSIENIGGDELKDARKLWSQSMKMRDIERIVANAELMDNPTTGIKTGFRTLARNQNRLRPYTEVERKLIRQAAETGIVSNALRMAGSRLNAVAGFATGGPVVGAGMYAAGAGARKAADSMQMRRVGELVNEVATGAQKTATPAASGMKALPYSPVPAIGFMGGIESGVAQQKALPQPMKALPAPSSYTPQSSLEPPPAPLLDRIAQAESGGNPNAQAPTSTASGLFQFTDPTWQSTVRKYGREYGVKMQDKANPEAQRKMAGALMQEHREALSRSLKREPTEGELYLAHFAGSGGAKRLLKAPENAPAARILPKAALANRSIFYDGKRMRTVGEVINLITEKV